MNKTHLRDLLIKEVTNSNLSQLAREMITEMLDSDKPMDEKPVSIVRIPKAKPVAIKGEEKRTRRRKNGRYSWDKLMLKTIDIVGRKPKKISTLCTLLGIKIGGERTRFVHKLQEIGNFAIVKKGTAKYVSIKMDNDELKPITKGRTTPNLSFPTIIGIANRELLIFKQMLAQLANKGGKINYSDCAVFGIGLGAYNMMLADVIQKTDEIKVALGIVSNKNFVSDGQNLYWK